MLKTFRILVSAQHALMLAYRAEIYLWVIAHILPFIMMSLWTNAATKSPGAFAMTPIEYTRYFLAAFTIRQFSAVWMIHVFEYDITQGTLTYHLLRPLNTLWHYLAAHAGEQIARFPFFLIVLVIFFSFYPKALWWPGLPNLLLGITAIYAAFAVRFAMQYCVAMLTFWFERSASLDQFIWIPYLFLSGMVVPLADFPPRVAAWVRLTPFPYMLDFPARLLTGSLRATDPNALAGFAIMAAWFSLFAAIGALLWKAGLRKYSGQGA